ncbi:mevalonate kinase [Halorutilales archaeon Cl-col2-1]
METSSAPGKVFLFGEHAVVYGEPAVVCAIDRRVTVAAGTTDNTRDSIHADADTGLPVSEIRAEYDGERTILTGETDGFEYIETAVDRAREEVESDARLEIEIESELPIGAGLGSSAAVVVATVDAVTRELGVELDPERIAEIGHEVEKEVQGAASPADTFTSAVGGVTYVEPDDELRSLDTEEFSETELVVGYDGDSAPTGEMVEGVRRLREESDVAARVVESIGDLTREGVDAVKRGDIEETGDLMNLNHGLLEALGVGSSSLSRMVWAARDSGAEGAKITGAGGGGCVVAVPGDDPETVAAGTEIESERVFEVTVSDGVRRE